MAAVLEPKDSAAKHNSQVDEQIAQATSRIRAHDLAFGGLVLAALVLVYATAMICLDKYLDLPKGVRQVALACFGVALAGTAYLTLFSPLRKRINPLYAARQVERTIEDPKNSVTGYVDAREKDDLNATVKAALASKAAKAAAEADVNKAVDHTSLIYLGGVSVVFLLALIVLFFVFRPTQFASLVGRTFVPFSSTPIASRTHIEIASPNPHDPTITTGQSVTVAVYVTGKVPKPDAPDKVRLLIRHNLADPNYDELPMVQGATSRDWELRVPDYLVQNGFWYKVAGGDFVTEEYKVTVRSLPMFSGFLTTYEYPKYLNRKSDTTDDPVIKAPRGTTVTLLAKTNRQVRDGLMVLEPSNTRVAGAPDPNDPTALKFVFKLAEAGKHKLTFTATNGERTIEPFQGTILVESDAAPRLVINKPEDDETTEPANGLVKIEGKAGDDFGIDTITLKMKIVAPVERPLADQPYLNGKSTSFRREKDDTWPTDVDYKGSIDLGALKKDAAGLPLELTPDMVIEYWLEATDNCTEPKPNVGASKPKRVRLTAPKVEPKEQQNLDKQKEQRKNEEKQHNEDQKQKLDQEKREPKTGPQKPGEKPEKGDNNNNTTDPMGGMGAPMPKMGDGTENPPKTEPKTDMMPGMGMGDPMGPKNDSKVDPKTDPKMDGKSDPKLDAKSDGKGGNPKPDPKVDQTAKDFQRELEQDKTNGGESKPNSAPAEKDRTDPGKAKPQPKNDMGMAGMPDMGGMGASEPKPEPKQPEMNPANPMGGNNAAPSTAKPENDGKKPEDPATTKPEPKTPEPKGGDPNSAPSETRTAPSGAPPTPDKPQPKGQPQPKDPTGKSEQQDPNSGSSGKPSTERKDDPSTPKPGTTQPDPAADAGTRSKPMETKPGTDKPPAQPQPKNPPTDPNMGQTAPKTPDTKANEPDAGTGKPQTAPSPGATKPEPKEGPMPTPKETDPKPAGGANDMMKPNTTNAAEARPEDGKKSPAPGTKPVEKGTDKPSPQDTNKGDQNPAPAPAPKPKLDEKELKDLQNAAKDLANGDEKQKQAARDKLDKAVGADKRKELEKLANDLKSPDENTRKAAQKKVEDAIKEQGKKGDNAPTEPKNDPKNDPQQGLTEQQKKDIENAVNDLQSPDADKKRAAQEKLDKMVGPDKRKEVEQMMEDLKSNDKAKQEAAKKKLDDLKKEFDKQNAKKDAEGTPGAKKGDEDAPKAKEPTKEELDDLIKKAEKLQSMDEQTRKQAQKELDEQIGEENRKKLEEMLKNENLKDAQSADKVRQQLKEWKQGLGEGTPAKGRMADLQKQIKSSELLLEQFEKEENRKRLQEKKGWTDEEYKKFLDDYRKSIDLLKDELKKEREKAIAAGAAEPGSKITTGGASKIEGTGGTTSATGGSPGVAPPGFEDIRRRFEEAMKKKP